MYSLTRRQFLISGAAIGSSLLAYARFESQLLQVRTINLRLATPLKSPIRLLHLSDLHASPPIVSLNFLARAFELGLQQKPDLILLTGDYVTRYLPPGNEYQNILRTLANYAPTFASFGNQDGGDSAFRTHGGYRDTSTVGNYLQSAGIVTLENQAQRILIGQQYLDIIGLSDMSAFDLDAYKNTFLSLPPIKNIPRIVLFHDSDGIRHLIPFTWDLVLAGHNHGGQLVVPFSNGYAPFSPISRKRNLQGLMYFSGRPYYITAGVGNLHGVRFNCPPEISLLIIH